MDWRAFLFLFLFSFLVAAEGRVWQGRSGVSGVLERKKQRGWKEKDSSHDIIYTSKELCYEPCATHGENLQVIIHLFTAMAKVWRRRTLYVWVTPNSLCIEETEVSIGQETTCHLYHFSLDEMMSVRL